MVCPYYEPILGYGSFLQSDCRKCYRQGLCLEIITSGLKIIEKILADKKKQGK